MKPIAPVVYVFLAVMLLLDAAIGAMIWRQLAVARWPVVEGVVTLTSVERDYESSRFASCPSISFRYTVDGTEYESDRYRSGRFCSTSPYDAESVSSDVVAGDRTSVYVNPRDPTEAYLAAGIGRVEHLGMLALLPFNAFGFGWLLEIAARAVAGRSLTAGVRYQDHGSERIATLPAVSPLSFMLGTLLVVGFALAVAGVLGFEYFTLSRFRLIWRVVGALCLATFVGKTVWNALRKKRLVACGGTVTLPDGTRLTGAELVGVGVQSGDANPPHPTYHRTVLLVDLANERRTIELPEFPSEDEAQRLAVWIELGV